MELKRMGPGSLLLLEESLKKPVTVVANEEIEKTLDPAALKQAVDTAQVYGVEHVALTPDTHVGWGCPVGCVIASSKVILPAVVGVDIGCGMRLLRTSLRADSVGRRDLQRLVSAMDDRIPTGFGSHKRPMVDHDTFSQVLAHGLEGLKPDGKLSFPQDFENVERTQVPKARSLEEVGELTERGHDILPGDPKKRGPLLERAWHQLGTLGGGNHFIEVQAVEESDGTFGLEPGTLCVMLHSGSRNFGNVLADYHHRKLLAAFNQWGTPLVNRELVYVPMGTQPYEDYYTAMAMSMNFSIANRHLMMVSVRDAFREVLGRSPQDLGMDLVYDIAHNHALEEPFDKQGVRVVHRKGATRALPPSHPLTPRQFRETGHPVLIPGSMGTFSYVLTGVEGAGVDTCHSVCHGAGRAMGRMQAKRTLRQEEVEASMGEILTNQRSLKTIIDEAPACYKPVDAVVDSCVQAGLVRVTARLRPLAVLKGAD